MTPTEIAVEVPITWTEWELPSPRHRKPQPVERHGTETAHIRVVTAEEAPLAFTVPEYGSRPEFQIRFFDGGLYRLAVDHRDDEPAAVAEEWVRDTATRHAPPSWMHSREHEVRTAIANAFVSNVSIDGQLWTACGEPQYVVMTFGMGHNHGGTALMYETHRNPNVAEESYFLADEGGAAVAHAIETAEERGDDKSVDHIHSVEAITVHDASAVGLTAARVTRLNLPSLYDVEPQDYAKVKIRYLTELAKVDGALAIEDGVTRVNFDTLTESQAAAVRQMLSYPADHGIV